MLLGVDGLYAVQFLSRGIDGHAVGRYVLARQEIQLMYGKNILKFFLTANVQLRLKLQFRKLSLKKLKKLKKRPKQKLTVLIKQSESRLLLQGRRLR